MQLNSLLFKTIPKIFLTLFILLLAQDLAKSQNEPIAKFSFDSRGDIDLVNKHQIKKRGASFCEDRFGNSNHALYLFGNEYSYLNLGNYSALKPEEGSISLWVMLQTAVATGSGYDANPILLTKHTNKDDFFESYGIYLDIGTKKLVVSCAKDSLEQVRIFSKNKLDFSEWQHIVVVYNNTLMSVYLNGELQGSIAKPFRTTFLPTDSVLVGVSANKKNNRYMEGAVDDIAFYNINLNPEQIDALYKSPNPNRFALYINWTIRFLLVVFLIGLIVWIATLRYKTILKKEHERDQLNARMNELETKAIRTQMNPHFVFNSLNTLQRFVLEKDFDSAHAYLTKFSRLLRKMLESSTNEMISLPEEISILDHYLELENLRSDNSFLYKITNSVSNAENTFIPIMLIQPFVENAIWHGIMAKKGVRILSISFENKDANRLQCIIDDNGVGRANSLKYRDPLKKKSLATEFIRQRLELIQKSTGIPCSFEIVDKKDPSGESLGTTVTIILPILNSI